MALAERPGLTASERALLRRLADELLDLCDQAVLTGVTRRSDLARSRVH